MTDLVSIYAERGDYFDHADEIPNDMVLSTMRASERILKNPGQFPNADFDWMERANIAATSEAASRLLIV
jgi:hypothetical protein